jgi:hypothetical protein
MAQVVVTVCDLQALHVDVYKQQNCKVNNARNVVFKKRKQEHPRNYKDLSVTLKL